MNTESLTYVIRFEIGGDLVALGFLALVALGYAAYYGLAIWREKG